MDAGTVATVAGAIIAAIALVTGSIISYKQLRSVSAAEQERADAKHATDITTAEEKVRRDYERALAEMTADRNYERGRADGLQTLINTRGLKGES